LRLRISAVTKPSELGSGHRSLRTTVALDHLKSKQIRRRFILAADWSKRPGITTLGSKATSDDKIELLPGISTLGRNLCQNQIATGDEKPVSGDIRVEDKVLDELLAQLQLYKQQKSPPRAEQTESAVMTAELKFSLECYREEAIFGQQTLQILEQAISVIDSIGRVCEEHPSVF